jgi:hypothetical protein
MEARVRTEVQEPVTTLPGDCSIAPFTERTVGLVGEPRHRRRPATGGHGGSAVTAPAGDVVLAWRPRDEARLPVSEGRTRYMRT